MGDARQRNARLDKHFHDVLTGKQKSTNTLFLEAVCAQPSVVPCVDKLIGSVPGLDALAASLHRENTTTFLNGLAARFLMFIQSPDLRPVHSGDYLRKILKVVVDPPIFWNTFLAAFQSGQLAPDTQSVFAWLLLELVQLPQPDAEQYLEVARDNRTQARLADASNLGMAPIARRIQQILDGHTAPAPLDNAQRPPGDRHDNDFDDFRRISILPTALEIASKEPPFLRTSTVVAELDATNPASVITYLDNQFRLLREDMLYELRESTQIGLGQKKGRIRGLMLKDLKLLDVYFGPDNRRVFWGLQFQCKESDFPPQLAGAKDRKKFLMEPENRNKIARHGALTCLIADGLPIGFPSIHRDEDLLAKKPPVIVLQFPVGSSVSDLLLRLKSAKELSLVQIDAAVFAYEPVLRGLQSTFAMALDAELLFWRTGALIGTPPVVPQRVIDALENDSQTNLKSLLQLTKNVRLDSSQAASFLSGLRQSVSLIQGPPGTGKSFIGALLAKALYDYTPSKILVVCYTNHALDQFLEDLLDIGIPGDAMIRLGGKSTTRTSALSLFKQDSTFRPTRAHYALRDDAQNLAETFLREVKRYHSECFGHVGLDDYMAYLEFEAEDYFNAFTVPASTDGMTQVGGRGRDMTAHYLIERWLRGQDAGVFKKHPQLRSSLRIWLLPRTQRDALAQSWRDEITKDSVSRLCDAVRQYNVQIEQLVSFGSERDASKLASKRIVACTTTAAAKYSDLIRKSASPDVVLVEEAGEILESHVLTALGPQTKQLILIGDHKQLRPKVNHYQLTVEKGEGFDLNMSLFERLVLRGFPHEKLTMQHRMRPEISSLIRELMYPDLVDAPATRGRANLRGVRDNVVFINHSKPEDDDKAIADRREGNILSKVNSFEIEMVLKMVRYLGQQGYGTDDIVILTPYLGNLRKILGELRKTTEPILNDMDNAELLRAGLISPGAASLTKKAIRLATIDNYQGEEAKIVVVSLTRSNDRGDIGFMSSAERLNVMLSRARDGLIMIGNSATFMKSRKGSEPWTKLFDLLRNAGHMYDGLPTQCERHPDKQFVLKEALDFDRDCPDGGCDAPCGAQLACGHGCPSKCHNIVDHSKMPCDVVVDRKCGNGHIQKWKCSKGPPETCHKCDKKKKDDYDKLRREFELQERRDREQKQHEIELAKLDAEIEAQQANIRDGQLAEQRRAALEQKRADLARVADSALRATAPQATPRPQAEQRPAPTTQSPRNLLTMLGQNISSFVSLSASSVDSPKDVRKSPQASIPPVSSPSRDEWTRQKEVEGQSNAALDDLMAMTGLEEVKSHCLDIKAKIDTLKRQGVSLSKERFNAVFLGNPGTGKTTVARIYAKFLTSVDVLPGSDFVETTGARLASEGVDKTKAMVETVLSNGGGTIFVDEAYQLVSRNSVFGGQVLDFLLAEMENNAGNLVFIFAGYTRQMEEFFEHNPGLASRVPHRLKFTDYTDAELLDMFTNLVDKRYKGAMKAEDGLQGLYARIAIRRLGRGRGRPGFGNARALENLLQRITERQAKRLARLRQSGAKPDDLLLAAEDLIGPEPSTAVVESDAWKKLQKMIGLASVKDAVRALVDMLAINYKRELEEKEPAQVSLNKTFLGSPGTGKTTVAKLYGQILVDLGMLSNGEVVDKNPSDFVGSALGQSEEKTKKILDSSVGKVLVIDEAYMLHSSSSGGADIYRTAVIDTMVAEIQSTPGEDRCVLLLGYKQQMEDMFNNVNPGLARRFAIEDAFTFDDFSDEELDSILDMKLEAQDLSATPAAKRVAIELLSRQRNRPNFGNAGAVENLISQAKLRFQKRRSTVPSRQRAADIVFEPEDFDPDHARQGQAAVNVATIFQDVVGRDDVQQKLQEYVKVAVTTKARGMDVRQYVPTCFIFKGPPGTGKTTIARKFGQVFFDLGFLASTEVIECSASDLVGQYVGQTGPKVVQQLERALGRVLFIDEAYRLADGHFAKEAVDELVGLLTQDKFKGKVVVILAGYEDEINSLLSVNPGLSSRFPDEFVFTNIHPDACLNILTKKLGADKIRAPSLTDPAVREGLVSIIEQLSQLPSWGNARDMETIAKAVARQTLQNEKAIQSDGSMRAEEADIRAQVIDMLRTRQQREMTKPATPPFKRTSPFQMPPTPAAPSPPKITTTHATAQTRKEEARPSTPQPSTQGEQRDAGVSDAVWQQLQADRRKMEEEQKAARTERERLELQQKEAAAEEKKQKAERDRLEAQLQHEKDAARRAEALKLWKAARLAEEQERIRRREAAARMEEQRREQEKEQQVQQKLRRMGVCVAGFQWIKQAGGYRCAGGSHFVSDSQLE